PRAPPPFPTRRSSDLKTGRPIPAGWALDRDGNPTTDPQAALIPLPLGGPKGSGLSLMIELITSLSSRTRSSPARSRSPGTARGRSEEHTSELQSRFDL